MFKPYGNVIYTDIATKGGQQNSKSLGWGKVKFATLQGCNHAIQNMNGVNCKGRFLEVRMDVKENSNNDSTAQHNDSSNSNTKTNTKTNRPKPSGYAAYVGNLPFEVEWQELKDLYKNFGMVTHAEIATENGLLAGKSQGWGIVYFVNKKDRDQAVSQLNGTEWDGRIIECWFDELLVHHEDLFTNANSNKSNGNGNSNGGAGGAGGADGTGKKEWGIYVGNLPWTCDWKQLKDTFRSQFKDVIYADVATEGGVSSGKSKGFGVVQFSNQHSRDEAIKRYNGSNMGGRQIEVRVDKKK